MNLIKNADRKLIPAGFLTKFQNTFKHGKQKLKTQPAYL